MNVKKMSIHASESPYNYSVEKTKKLTKAAITIQSRWRGNVIRKNLRPFSKMANQERNIDETTAIRQPVGNDHISFAVRHISSSKRPAILAAGGAQCLHNAMQLSMKPDGTLTHHNPMIFLVDIDQEYQTFWRELATRFRMSTDIESFLNNLPGREIAKRSMLKSLFLFWPDTLIKKWNPFSLENVQTFDNRTLFTPNISESLFRVRLRFNEILTGDRNSDPDDRHPIHLSNFFERLFNDDEDKFEWIKRLVLHHIIPLIGDWTDSPELFQAIKKICNYHDYGIVVYASNIEDMEPEKYYKRKLWENIHSLSPLITVKSISRPIGEGVFEPLGTEYFDEAKILQHIRKINTPETVIIEMH